MSRVSYDDWVPEKYRKQYFRLEQTMGSLEVDPLCLNACSTLFWQLYFSIKRFIEIKNFNDQTENIRRQYEDLVASGDNTSEEIKVLSDQVEAILEESRKPINERMGEWSGFDFSMLDRAHRVLIDHYSGSNVLENTPKLSDQAYICLHLAAILLRARRLVSWGSTEIQEELIREGELAFNLLQDRFTDITYSSRRINKVIIPEDSIKPGAEIETLTLSKELDAEEYEQQKDSLTTVAYYFLVEAFWFHKEHQDYLKALYMYATHKAFLSASNSALEYEKTDQNGANCFESILINKSTVSDWKSVVEWCSIVADNIDQIDPEIKDIRGLVWPPVQYWTRASTLAENEMSPSEYVKVQRIERIQIHDTRMKRDFLGELFELLEPRSKQALRSAEMFWYQGQDMDGRIEGAANELRHVFEWELRALIFKRTNSSIKNMLLDTKLREKLHLDSNYFNQPIDKLSLWDMSKLLQEARNSNFPPILPVREVIEGFHIDRKSKDFLYNDLPIYLMDLVKNVRNLSEHPAGTDITLLVNRLGEMRRKALGIGGESYIVKLLNIKKAITEK
jgi:hypothetical protein